MTYDLRYYQSGERRPLVEWLEALKDRHARARIQIRLDRLSLGNFGDHRVLGGGVYELKIDWGPGYRVYFARTGDVILLLLCGGDVSIQPESGEGGRPMKVWRSTSNILCPCLCMVSR